MKDLLRRPSSSIYSRQGTCVQAPLITNPTGFRAEMPRRRPRKISAATFPQMLEKNGLELIDRAPDGPWAPTRFTTAHKERPLLTTGTSRLLRCRGGTSNTDDSTRGT